MSMLSEGLMSTEAFVSPDALARVLDADRSSNGTLLQGIVDSELLLRQLRAWQLGCVRELIEHTQPVQRSPRSTRNSKRPIPEDETLTDAFGPNTASQIRSGSLVSAQLAPELTLSRNSAWSLARTSVELPRDLPMIAALFEAGRLDWDRARLINDRLHRPPHKPEWFGPDCPQWLLFQVALAEQAPSLPYHALQVLIDQLLLGLAPDAANERHAQARQARSVWTELLPDGMTAVHAILAADDGQLLDGVLDAMADACRDRLLAEGRTDPRTHEQRRADALAAIVQALAEGLDIPLARDTRREQADDETDRRADDGDPEPEPTDENGNSSSTGPDAHDMTGAPNPSEPSEPSGDAVRNTHAGDAGRPAATVAKTTRPSDEPVEAAACPTCRHRAHENLDEATDQARSDSFSGFGFSALPQGQIPAWWELPSLPRKKGHGPHLVITITDATLLGLDNVPGLLQGYGVVPADLARRIAASARDITLLPVPGAATGSNGQPDPSAGPAPGCSYGRDHSTPQAHRYHPGRVLTDQVNARYQTCTFPGCSVPSNRCDLDHLVPFDEGGATCPCNLHPACRTHHNLKTSAGWSTRFSKPDERLPAGTVLWVTPEGRVHASPPPVLPGSPGWTLPLSVPSDDDEFSIRPATFTRNDTLPAPQRTADRLRRWQRDIEQVNDEIKRAARRRRDDRSERSSFSGGPVTDRGKREPWGTATGNLPDYPDPPF